MFRTTLKLKQLLSRLACPACPANHALLYLLFLPYLLLPTLNTWAADIQIRNLQDIDFGVVPPTVGNLRADAEFCVAMQPRGRYALIGTGTGPSGDFSITQTGSGRHSINYSVRVSDRGNRFGQALRPGIAMDNLRAANRRPDGRCQPTSRIRVVVQGAQLATAHPGRYEGTLSLTVVPE